MKKFNQLTMKGRALRLKKMAKIALKRYSLDVVKISLITNETNCIFRIDTKDRQKYVMRITDPAGCHEYDEVNSEMHYLNYLKSKNFLVPQPIATRDNKLAISVGVEGVPEERTCVLFSWIPGKNLEDDLNTDNVYLVGKTLAKMHKLSAQYNPPVNFKIRTKNNIFPYSNPQFKIIEPIVLFDTKFNHHFPGERKNTFEQANKIVKNKLQEIYSTNQKMIILHNDMNLWNIKIHRDDVYVFDFEDLMWGYPVQDIAVSMYYLLDEENEVELLNNFKEGYKKQNSWNDEYDEQIPFLFAARDLMMVNYILNFDYDEYKEMAPAYIEKREKRLKNFLNL